MPAGDQIDCYLSCNVRINKGELKKEEKRQILTPNMEGDTCGKDETFCRWNYVFDALIHGCLDKEEPFH